MDLQAYRSGEDELARAADLLRLVPKNRESVLDIGARDGHFSKLLTQLFKRVVALDIKKPGFQHPGVTTVAGDATRLEFPDRSFDCVFCAEVLEHVPDLEQACREISRVARHDLVIGVPYKQDTRVARTTCHTCGKVGPPWGHVNTFDERRLAKLFREFEVRASSFVGTTRSATNPLSVYLLDLAGNPWGTYDQEEPCIHCGAALVSPPAQRSIPSRLCARIAVRLNALQQRFAMPHGNWIHMAFSRSAA